MIKINLLPPYFLEARRIKITIIVFVALFVIEGVAVLGYQSGLKQQESWFNTDKQRRDSYAETLKTYSDQAGDLQKKSTAYDDYNETFADLGPIKKYNQDIAKAFISAGQKLGGGSAWYEKLVLNSDGSIQAQGKIKGSMKFLSYYFRLKDEGFTLTPAVEPYPTKTMSQVVNLDVAGKVDALPTPPSLPAGAGNPDQWNNLYQKAGAAAAAGGAPGAAGAPGAPAAAPAPGPAGATPASTGTPN